MILGVMEVRKSFGWVPFDRVFKEFCFLRAILEIFNIMYFSFVNYKGIIYIERRIDYIGIQL